jgi:hypothetical protein
MIGNSPENLTRAKSCGLLVVVRIMQALRVLPEGTAGRSPYRTSGSVRDRRAESREDRFLGEGEV